MSLLRTFPATLRFVSVEPMLEPITMDLTGIDWVICGGERTRRAVKPRFMDPDWARDLRRQSQMAGVPFFMKQMTAGAPIPADLVVREFPAVC